MATFEKADDELSNIIKIINQHNRQQSKNDAVRFIYPGTSFDLAWVGKTVTITRPTESEIVLVPMAIMPKYLLRKRYGINPFLSEQKIKNRIERYLNGATPDKDGVLFCIEVLQRANLYISIERLHQNVLETIIRITPQNYLRSINTVIMLLSNLKLLDPDLMSKADSYLKLLSKEIEMLVVDSRDRVGVRHICNKFLQFLSGMLNTRSYIIQPSEQFRAEVSYQYPIVYCSTVDGNPHPSQLFRRDYDNELSLSTVKIAFTPSQYVSQLQTKLNEIGYGNLIKVYGYVLTMSGSTRSSSQQDKEKKLMEVTTPAELVEVVREYPEILQQPNWIEEKIERSLQAFSEGKGEPSLAIAVWLLKHADVKTLKNIEKVLALQEVVSLYTALKAKTHKQPEYGQLVSELLPGDCLSRLKKVPYLQELAFLRKEVKHCQSLFDFSKKLRSDDLVAALKPRAKEFSSRTHYLYVYLHRLQAYYTVLTRETVNKIEEAENINSRLRLVRELYTELLSEYVRNRKPTQTDHPIIESELYQAVKDAIPNQRIWGKIFPFSKTQSTV